MPRPIRLVTSVELASRLGVSRRTVLRYAHSGRIPKPIVLGDTFTWRESVAARIVAAHQATPPTAA